MSGTYREFNTGRAYTDDGQIIRWEVEGESTIFVDVSRRISGKIPHVCRNNDDVLRFYDASAYDDYLTQAQLLCLDIEHGCDLKKRRSAVPGTEVTNGKEILTVVYADATGILLSNGYCPNVHSFDYEWRIVRK